MERELQLRIYRTEPGRLADFVDGWRRGVAPLRERFGFRVEAAWASLEDDTFAWLVSYEGEDGFAAADARYYASPERAALSPDPARLLAETRTLFVRPVAETRG
ncbi:MAG TPA: NIPSNAP family protein [Candidatus Limnocylindrales bacterium]|jgi:hypothetical protein|nr:NIPSNAP family protein [Candidatus Limnocylindrales bacterium]